jgi:hypothetical protein
MNKETPTPSAENGNKSQNEILKQEILGKKEARAMNDVEIHKYAMRIREALVVQKTITRQEAMELFMLLPH